MKWLQLSFHLPGFYRLKFPVPILQKWDFILTQICNLQHLFTASAYNLPDGQHRFTPAELGTICVCTFGGVLSLQRGRDSTFLCSTQGFWGVPLQLQQCQKEGAGALQTSPNLPLAYHHKYQWEQQYTDRPTRFSLRFAAHWQFEGIPKWKIIF